MSLSEEALGLHSAMLDNPGHAYSQQELEDILGVSKRASLVDFLRELIQHHRVKLLQEQDGKLFYQAVTEQIAKVVGDMTPDEAMVYSYVESAGREGIWTKTIRIRSGLHQHVVNRCLKALETRRITKSIKSVKFPTRKIVMLYHLQPSIEVTGGPWFTDTELDVEFVNLMLNVVWKYVARETFGTVDGDAPQVSRLPDLGPESYPSLDDIQAFVQGAQLSTVELEKSDIQGLCDVLAYDRKFEKVDATHFRATWPSVLAAQGRFQCRVPVLPSPI